MRCSLACPLGNGTEPHQLRLVDVLPLGVRELEILDDENPLAVAEVVGLLERKAELVPGLQCVTVHVQAGSQRSILMEACMRADVLLVTEYV